MQVWATPIFYRNGTYWVFCSNLFIYDIWLLFTFQQFGPFFVIFYFVCCGCHLIHHHKTYVHTFGTLCQSQYNGYCFQSSIVGIYSDFILLKSLRWHYCSVSAILKVIARLLNKSKPCAELDDVRKLFLDDLICLCENNEDNRRWDNFTV